MTEPMPLRMVDAGGGGAPVRAKRTSRRSPLTPLHCGAGGIGAAATGVQVDGPGQTGAAVRHGGADTAQDGGAGRAGAPLRRPPAGAALTLRVAAPGADLCAHAAAADGGTRCTARGPPGRWHRLLHLQHWRRHHHVRVCVLRKGTPPLPRPPSRAPTDNAVRRWRASLARGCVLLAGSPFAPSAPLKIT